MLPAPPPARPTTNAGLAVRPAMTAPPFMFRMPLPASPTQIWLPVPVTRNPLLMLAMPRLLEKEHRTKLFAPTLVHAPPVMFKTPRLFPPGVRPIAVQLLTVTDPPERLNTPRASLIAPEFPPSQS